MSATMNLQEAVRTETVVTPVRFVCPRCGSDRDGIHVCAPNGDDWVECDDCEYRCDPDVLDVPTESVLNEWYAQALRHGRASLRCADGTPACSYLAIVWCRRLAPELSIVGKLGYLDRVARQLGESLTDHQRSVLVELGIALQLPAALINDVLTGF